ncbi:MAG: YIP1 family protein [Chitinophagales bacterium]
MEERQMGIVQKITGVFISPIQTFKAIAEDTEMLKPVVAVLVINMLLTLLVLPEVVDATREALKNSGQQIPADQMRMMITYTKIMTVVGALVLPPFLWLIESLLLLLYNQLSIGQGSFKQFYAISFFAWLPAFLGSAIKTALIPAIGYEQVLAIKTSLALFLPPATKSGFLFILLSRTDFFTIWSLILLALGGAVVMKKDSKGVMAYMLGLWLVLIALMAFIATKTGAGVQM